MEILRLISIAFGFIGSVLLSIGLIRSKQQIEDESGSYYGYNPYLLENLSAERKIVIPGFIFLLAGFSFQFSTEFPFFPQSSRIFNAVMLGITLTALGILIFDIFIRIRETAHAKRHEAKQIKYLKQTLVEYRDDNWVELHPETLKDWVGQRMNNLRGFKGELSNQLWTTLEEGLISALERDPSLNNQRIKQVLGEWISKNLP